MNIFGRTATRTLSAVTQKKHWQALARTPRVHDRPGEALKRYVFNTGDYPWTPSLRTPTGRISISTYGPQDVRTINEIFCRQDYGPGGQKVVVDLGANIGIASLFFATRSQETRIYASEPVPRNLERLTRNTVRFEDRITIDSRAVAPSSGTASFVIEDTGRLGGLTQWSARPTDNTIDVECVSVADLLEDILTKEGRIGLVKVDTEGSEAAIIDAIPAEQLDRIDAIVWESRRGTQWQTQP